MAEIMGPEMFPIEAFVGMISDEIEALRKRGKTDSEIALLIEENSAIRISPQEIILHYAPPEERRHHNE
jgi:intein-encoded DNA endonuclease-like protein